MISRTAQKQLTLLRWSANAIGAAGVIVVLLGAYHAHRLLGQERSALEDRRNRDLALMASAKQLTAQRDDAVQRLRTLDAQLQELKSRLPSSPNEAEFLAQLSALAERSSVRIKNFRPGQAAGAGLVQTCDVQLSVAGSFANICRLLDGLHDLPRNLRVNHLALSGPSSAGEAC